MQRSISSVSIKLASLTAALALCGAAYAATGAEASAPMTAQTTTSATTPDASGNQSAHRHHKSGEHRNSMRGHMRDAAMWVPGYGPLNTKFVESLALTDSQAKLLKDAQDEQKASRSARRDAMKSARAEKQEQLKSGKIDPRATLKQTEEAHKQAYAERSKQQGKWLSVWDALDATQQQKVAAEFNERAEKFAKRAENHKHRNAAPDSAKVVS